MLHLIALPHNDPRLYSAIKLISAEDDIVLLDHGVDLASSVDKLTPLTSTINANVHLLVPSAKLSPNANNLPLTYIDATKLLALTEKHAASVSWYPDADAEK